MQRRCEQALRKALAQAPAVLLEGPRQVGKSTLAVKVASEMPSEYFTLASEADRDRLLQDTTRELRKHKGKLVTIDDAAPFPELAQPLQAIIDERKHEGLATGQFLLVGSTSGVLSRKAGHPLTGRSEVVGMAGIDLAELGGKNMQKLWDRGGLPPSYLAANDAASLAWRKEYYDAHTRQDLQCLGESVNLPKLNALLKLLAASQGCLLNINRIASASRLSKYYVEKYLGLLEQVMVLRRLPPFHTTIRKRLVKASKCYVRDSGIANMLLGAQVATAGGFRPSDLLAASWEGFVVENLLATLPASWQPYFYRTHDGAEIELILERPGGQLWAIKITANEDFTLGRGSRQSLRELKPERAFVVHGGERRWSSDAPEVEALPLQSMINELLAQDQDTRKLARPAWTSPHTAFAALREALKNARADAILRRQDYVDTIISEAGASLASGKTLPFTEVAEQLKADLAPVAEWVGLECAMVLPEQVRRDFPKQVARLLEALLELDHRDESNVSSYLAYTLLIKLLACLLDNDAFDVIHAIFRRKYLVANVLEPVTKLRFMFKNGEDVAALREFEEAFRSNVGENTLLLAADFLFMIYSLLNKSHGERPDFLIIPRHYTSYPTYRVFQALVPEFFRRAETAEGLQALLACLGESTAGLQADLGRIRKKLLGKLTNSIIWIDTPSDFRNELIRDTNIRNWGRYA